jgi:DedD protein
VTLELFRGRPYLENRAKERLTGAVILVALIVLLVPELFAGRARAPATGAGTAEEQPLSSYTFGLGDDARGSPGHAPGAALASASASAAPGAGSVSDSPPQPVPGSHPAAVSAASSASVASTASSARSSAPPSPSSHAGAARSAHATHAAPGSGWWVQVGSFTSRANADRLVQRLKSQGFSALSVEGSQSGRKWYRVRVGPQQSHAAAQTVAARLHASGHSGSIVPQS